MFFVGRGKGGRGGEQGEQEEREEREVVRGKEAERVPLVPVTLHPL